VVVRLWGNKRESEREMALTVAMASLRGVMHVFRVLANNGLVSPDDIDESSIGLIRDLEQLPESMQGAVQEFVVATFADLKMMAAANWKAE
jgi:hypothetical protein